MRRVIWVIRCAMTILSIALCSACSTPNGTTGEAPKLVLPQAPPPVALSPPPAPAPPPPIFAAPPFAVSAYLPDNVAEVSVAKGTTPEAFIYPVLFGTTRKPVLNGVGFSDEREEFLHYGRVLVQIPKNHKTGSLGSRWGTLTKTDPLLSISSYQLVDDEAHFLDMAEHELPPVTGPENSYVVVFIHGYNNSFEEAALRAAQLGVDLDVPSNDMFLFSWAAHDGNILKYPFDEATIDASEVYLRSYLATVARAAHGRKIHIIAHSMGNRALLRVISASLMNVSVDQQIHFGQIILAAADVDVDLFTQLAPNYVKVSDRTTVYLSPYDFAVAASSRIHDYPRVGCASIPRVRVPQIDNIVSTIPEDFPAHAYFAESIPILQDIKNLILRNKPSREGATWAKINDYWIVGGPITKHADCLSSL